MVWRSIARYSLVLVAFCAITLGLAAKKKPSAAPINLNTATSEELHQVPGIGPVTAEKILQMRKSYGAFKSVDDLRAVRGIGPKRLEKMRKYLTVSKAGSATKPANAPRPATPPKPSTVPADPPSPLLQFCVVPRWETKSRFLALLGMTSPECAASRNRDQSTWCVGRDGVSMRRGTWSAMRMP
jgi:comEA protein